MKKCPYCHADLQENAAFCLYCMTALKEKPDTAQKNRRRKWLLILLAVAAVFALAVGLAVSPDPPAEPTVQEIPTTAAPTEPALTESAPTEPAPTQTEPPMTVPPETEPPVTVPPETEPPATQAPTEPEPTLPPEDVFIFRKSESSDYYRPSNQMTAWDIVITGVKVQQEVYHIPDSIFDRYGGENRVAGIAPGAFEGSGAKVIYTSSYLMFIHEDAFKGCQLTDLYLVSVWVDLHPNAYASLETLHTSYDATTVCLFDGMHFHKIAKAVYNAEWEPW